MVHLGWMNLCCCKVTLSLNLFFFFLFHFLSFSEPYRFSIAMSNTHEKGYIDEKIVSAWLAHAVPIYFGAKEATDYYARGSFIHCKIKNMSKKMLELDSFHRPLELENDFAGTSASFATLMKKTIEILHEDLEVCAHMVCAHMEVCGWRNHIRIWRVYNLCVQPTLGAGN